MKQQNIKWFPDNQEWRLILMIALFFTVIRVFTSIGMYWEAELQGYSKGLSVFVQERIIAWGVHMIFVIIIVKTTNQFLLENLSWRKIIAWHLLLALVISVFWYGTFIGISHLLCPAGNCDEMVKKESPLLWYLQNFDGLIRMYMFTVSLTYTYYYIRKDGINKAHQSKIESQLLQARMMILKSQLHPHFLFNTLNSIASLMETNVKKAQDMIADLSDLLRNMLDFKDAQMVTLNDELHLLQKYIDIEKTRFSEQLELELVVEKNLGLIEIPNMLLQPLVENSIVHGFSPEHPQLKVDIQIFEQQGQLIIEVKDNGKGIKNGGLENIFDKGMGLKNTYERLKSIYGNQFIFRVENLPSGVMNRIEMPIKFVEGELVV